MYDQFPNGTFVSACIKVFLYCRLLHMDLHYDATIGFMMRGLLKYVRFLSKVSLANLHSLLHAKNRLCAILKRKD